MRLLLVGAFPYPHNQGSQVYFQEQAIALRAAGVEVSLLPYSSDASNSSKRRWRALDGFDRWTSPEWTSPRSLRSGPSWAKPLGDLGLAMTLRDAVASSQPGSAYDAILTHNAEAALVALHALPNSRPPVLYCVHTLLESELSAYLKRPKRKGLYDLIRAFGATGPMTDRIDRMGGRIDRWIAERVDGSISLTQTADSVMRQFSEAPSALIPPPIPDPELESEPLNPMEVASRHALDPGRFFLYSGNLDGYQELGILSAAAAELARRSESPPQIVIASHHLGRHPSGHARRQGGTSANGQHVMDRDLRGGAASEWAESLPGVEFRSVESSSEMQALLSAARASLVTRRARGGFPIKLVNSLATGTPVVAFHEQEWGLAHERNSLICAPDRPAQTLADAIERLAGDDALAERLSAGARALYLERHVPERAASDALDLIRRVRSLSPR
jgi:glycosyltransferase involved in cell wall biosynthesis